MHQRYNKLKYHKLYHSIPISCALALLLLSGTCINPLGFGTSGNNTNNSKAYAATELTSTTNDTNAALIVDDGNITDTILAESGVNYKSHSIRIKADNIKSYTLQISANSNGTSELKLQGGSTTIGGAGGKTGDQMTANTWGYAWGDANATESSMTYFTLPAYGANSTDVTNGLLESSATSDGSVDITKKLSFAANFSDSVPSGHYITSVLLSLAVEPKNLPGIWSTGMDSGITTMQEMNSTVCNQVSTPSANTENNPTMVLADARDNNEYKIAKFADGNCWMTENLRLINKTLSSTDSDIISGNFIVPVSSNVTEFTSTNATVSKAHYDSRNANYGGYYNWYTAIAGSAVIGSTTGERDAPSSICPKNWRLPIYGTTQTDKSYHKLIGNIASSAEGSAILFGAPYNFLKSGYIDNGSMKNIDTSGRYWMASAANDNVRSFNISYMNFAIGQYLQYPYNGYSVRCVAR